MPDDDDAVQLEFAPLSQDGLTLEVGLHRIVCTHQGSALEVVGETSTTDAC